MVLHVTVFLAFFCIFSNIDLHLLKYGGFSNAADDVCLRFFYVSLYTAA